MFLSCQSNAASYIGSEPCALCHKEIAAKQLKTAMANTWQGRDTSWLPADFAAAVSDDLTYKLKRSPDAFTYSVANLNLPAEILLGGRRHGIGFLVPLSQVGGIPLARPTLIQARYAWSQGQKKLLLAPGCSNDKPQSLEAALGLVLSPTFESRCLACHGRPDLQGTGKTGGVHCESCHGPGSEHLTAIAHKHPKQGIVNPNGMSSEDSIAVCAQCHVGLTRFSDPSASDLLVANQVRAIKSSECFVQSGKSFSCITCHDPHSDAVDDAQAIHACLGCHSSRVQKHAAICPVNSASGCVGCHMPSIDMGPLHLVDHLIRVHPEQKIQAVKNVADLRTQVRPLSAVLRIIVANTPDAAVKARQRIQTGEPFYQVAQETSLDRTASIGGYLGRRALDSNVALDYGEISDVKQQGDRWVILQRLPRDFRWQAEQLQAQAEDLAAHGDAAAAIAKAQEALKIYPQFLRALNFIGVIYAQNGNPRKGADVLALALRLYPEDAPTQFALASVFELLGDTAQARIAYQKTITLETDFTAAYINLGRMESESADWSSAIATFRLGLLIDPLSAELNAGLALALTHRGDGAEAKQASALAHKLALTF